MKGLPDPALTRRAASAVVANELLAEREAQHAKWGEQNHPIVYTSPQGERYTLSSYGLWLPVRALQTRCDDRARRGTVAWADILVEELAEAIDAASRGDVAGARRELVQLGAVAVAVVESIDREGR
jgi:hypothetical protein